MGVLVNFSEGSYSVESRVALLVKLLLLTVLLVAFVIRILGATVLQFMMKA
jgi:hypothetical protein